MNIIVNIINSLDNETIPYTFHFSPTSFRKKRIPLHFLKKFLERKK